MRGTINETWLKMFRGIVGTNESKARHMLAHSKKRSHLHCFFYVLANKVYLGLLLLNKDTSSVVGHKFIGCFGHWTLLNEDGPLWVC